jgi:hypothetical protein
MGNSHEQNPSAVADIAKWRDSIEAITKIGLTFVGVAYVIGLLILNIHIGKFGVYYLGFFQVEYVMTGVLWCFLSGVSICLFYLMKSHVEIIFKSYKEKKKGILFLILTAATTIFAASFIPFFILLVLSDSKLTPASSAFWPAFGTIFINLIAILAVVLKFKNIYRLKSVQVKNETKYQSFIDTFNQIMLFVVALGLYANYVFPELSPAYGGGKKQLIEFIIKADQKETIKTIGIETSNDDRRFGPVEALFESPDFILILPQKGFKNENVKAIRINKNLIDASYFLSSK